MYRPYVAIDVETLGLDKEKSPIIELVAVLDDGGPINQLPTFKTLFPHVVGDYFELDAVVMNAAILKEIKEEKGDLYGEAAERWSKSIVSCEWGKFINWLANAVQRANSYDSKLGWKESGNICLAGKNAASSDIPWIINNLKRYATETDLKSFKKMVHYKVIDPGSMFMGRVEGGHVPSLGHINKITGRNENVSHRAQDDAMDVVYAIRNHFEFINKGK